jgi:hypothetical protein
LGYYYKSFQESVERSWSMTDVGHQFSPAYLYNQRNTDNCNQGAGMSINGGLSILRDKGAALLSAFPYDANDPCTLPSADVVADAWQYRVVEYAPLFLGAGTADLAVLKALLARGEPFVLAVPVYANFYHVSASAPVVQRPAAGEWRHGGHALFVAGYDDALGGFLVVNSWGADWGVNGRGYLSYEFVQHDATEGWVMVDHVDEGAPMTNEWRAWLPISASSSH